MNHIHPTAIISKEVKLGQDITIGPYAVIEGPVTIGNQVHISSHVRIEGDTTIGDKCQFFHASAIGAVPQDKKHKVTDKVKLIIGQGNIFREFTTVHPGTIDGGGITTIGDYNLLMANAHVAHDCRVGSHCVLANSAALAGHVITEDRVIVGGLCGIHQFCRIGYMSIIGGCSKLAQDLPPFMLAEGNPAKIRSLNLVGLKRANIDNDTQMLMRRAFKILFLSGLNRGNAIKQIEEQFSHVPQVMQMVTFIKASTRGIAN